MASLPHKILPSGEYYQDPEDSNTYVLPSGGFVDAAASGGGGVGGGSVSIGIRRRRRKGMHKAR